MGGPVEAVGSTTNSNSFRNDSAREIPQEKEVYSQADVGSAQDAELDEAIAEAAISYLGVEAFGLVNKGASDSKRIQDEAYKELREAENENGG